MPKRLMPLLLALSLGAAAATPQTGGLPPRFDKTFGEMSEKLKKDLRSTCPPVPIFLFGAAALGLAFAALTMLSTIGPPGDMSYFSKFQGWARFLKILAGAFLLVEGLRFLYHCFFRS